MLKTVYHAKDGGSIYWDSPYSGTWQTQVTNESGYDSLCIIQSKYHKYHLIIHHCPMIGEHNSNTCWFWVGHHQWVSMLKVNVIETRKTSEESRATRALRKEISQCRNVIRNVSKVDSNTPPACEVPINRPCRAIALLEEQMILTLVLEVCLLEFGLRSRSDK